jgi:hypothetical protein
MLPEERTLIAEQRACAIEQHFDMQLDGDKTGKSVRASLPRCLEADKTELGLALKHLPGHLTKRDDGTGAWSRERGAGSQRQARAVAI